MNNLPEYLPEELKTMIENNFSNRFAMSDFNYRIWKYYELASYINQYGQRQDIFIGDTYGNNILSKASSIKQNLESGFEGSKSVDGATLISCLNSVFILSKDLDTIEKNYVKEGKKFFTLNNDRNKFLFASVYTLYQIITRIHRAIYIIKNPILLINGKRNTNIDGISFSLLTNKYGRNLNRPSNNANVETKKRYYLQVAINQINDNIPLLCNISDYVLSLVNNINSYAPNESGNAPSENYSGGAKKKKSTKKRTTTTKKKSTTKKRTTKKSTKK